MKDRPCSETSYKDDTSQTEEQAGFKCNECGEQFREPLFTSVYHEGSVQTYYACPRCLSRIRETEGEATGRIETPASPEQTEDVQPEPKNEKCQHFLGYLKKRPKETVIPEDCLTCERIIECMAA
jgi:DNA-directed RNA polymerase subunit RPC12/RpoP